MSRDWWFGGLGVVAPPPGKVGTGRGRGRRRVVFVVCGMEERVTDVMYSFFCFVLIGGLGEETFARRVSTRRARSRRRNRRLDLIA